MPDALGARSRHALVDLASALVPRPLPAFNVSRATLKRLGEPGDEATLAI